MDKKVYVCDEGTCLRFHTSLLVATGSHNDHLVTFTMIRFSFEKREFI